MKLIVITVCMISSVMAQSRRPVSKTSSSKTTPSKATPSKTALRIRYAQSLEQMMRDDGKDIAVRAVHSNGWIILMFITHSDVRPPGEFDSIFVTHIVPDLQKFGFQSVVYRAGDNFWCRPLADKFKFRCSLILAAMKEIYPDNPVPQQSPGYSFDEFRSAVLYKSKEEVQRILGNPDRVSELSDGSQSWTYRNVAYDSLTRKVSSFTTVYFSKIGYAERVSF